VTLGDARLAERAAGFALAAGASQAAALRHPERAAAWLRARTLRTLKELGRFRHAAASDQRHAALDPLGVRDAVYRGLASIDLTARAALVASDIERFDPIDVETIIDAAPAPTRHVVAEARKRYLRLAGGSTGEEQVPFEGPTGGLAARVHRVATRAFSIDETPR